MMNERPIPAGAEQVDELVRVLLERSPGRMAELGLLPLVGLDEHMELVAERLSGLAPLRSTELSGAVISKAKESSSENAARLLSHLDPVVVRRTKGVSSLLDAMGASAWDRARSEGAPIVQDLFEQIGRLKPATKNPGPGLGRAVRQTLRRRVSDASEAEDLSRSKQEAALLADLGLLNSAFIADCIVASLTLTVDEPVPLSQTESVQQWADEQARQVLPNAGKEVGDLDAALRSESCWLDDHIREPLLICVAARLKDLGLRHQAPSSHKVIELLEIHGSAMAEAAGLWVGVFAADSAEVRLVEGKLRSVNPSQAADSFRKWVGSSTRRATELVVSVIGADSRLGVARTANAGLSQADPHQLADALVTRFNKETRNDDRRAILDTWARAQIEDLDARTRLVRDIYLPFAELNKEAFKLALPRFDLCHGVDDRLQAEVIDRMRGAASGRKAKASLEKKLERAGWI